ncbi:MAG: TraB/GumN family protein [Vicinamibacterales bacterium]
MVLRRILAAAITVALCAAPSLAQGKHFLWKVEGPNQSVAYLLGSLHVLTPEYYPLADEINKAYEASRTLIEELDFDETNDPAQMMNALGKAMLTDGRTLDQIVAPSTFAEVTKRAEKAGLPMVALQRMKPWLVAITLMGPTLQAAGFKAELGVDKHFFDRAKAAGLKRQALETLAYQIDRFDQLSPKLQEEMLVSGMKELDSQVGNVNEMAQRWAAGDVKTLEKSLLLAFDESRELYDRLLVERNRNWVPHVETCLQQNAGCFIVVGAAHLVGPDGLPAMLQKKGYKVTQQ